MVAFKKITSIPLLNVTVFVKTLSKCRCLVKNDIFMLFLYFELIKYNHFDLLSHFLVFSFNNVCNVCGFAVKMTKSVLKV